MWRRRTEDKTKPPKSGTLRGFYRQLLILNIHDHIHIVSGGGRPQSLRSATRQRSSLRAHFRQRVHQTRECWSCYAFWKALRCTARCRHMRGCLLPCWQLKRCRRRFRRWQFRDLLRRQRLRGQPSHRIPGNHSSLWSLFRGLILRSHCSRGAP